MRLEGKIALVTGASRGIGRAIALGFAREGADVAINYVNNEAAAEETAAGVRALGRRAIAVQADVAQRPPAEAMVAKVLEEFGRIDILVNNAGINNARGPFVKLTDDDFDRIITTNLRGPFILSHIVVQHMLERGSGRIINVTSECAQRGLPNQCTYNASKGGLLMLTRSLAIELAPYGIVVNALAPGTTETDLNAGWRAIPEVKAEKLARVPKGRFARPEDMAEAAIFLASAGAEMCIGATLNVDGGTTIG